MIQRVYNACSFTGIDTYVLTDDSTIAQCITDFGGNVYVDTTPYANGTERCAAAIENSMFDKYDTFINVQGDMPDITHYMVEQALQQLDTHQITTVFTSLSTELKDDPNAVKMIRSGDNALWFGRGITGYGEHHLGIYGYKRNPLFFYKGMDVTQEETVEQLEQLRWLKNGYTIGCKYTEFSGMEINTPEDAKEWNEKNMAYMG